MVVGGEGEVAEEVEAHGAPEEVGAHPHHQGYVRPSAAIRVRGTVRGRGGRRLPWGHYGAWQAIRGGVDTGVTLTEVRL